MIKLLIIPFIFFYSDLRANTLNKCFNIFKTELDRKKIALRQTFDFNESYTVSTLDFDNYYDYTLHLERAENLKPLNSITIEIEQTKYPVSNWTKGKIIDGTNEYHFVHEGVGHQGPDFSNVEETILKNFSPTKHDQMIIKFKGDKLETIKESNKQKYLAHQKVLETYRTRKDSYLSEEDFRKLHDVGYAFEEQSTWSILKASQESILNQGSATYTQNIKATLSAAYSTHPTYLSKLLSRAPSEFDYSHYVLPFIQRMEFSGTESFAQAIKYSTKYPKLPIIENFVDIVHVFDKQFKNKKKLAELIRFAKFEEITKEAQDYLILQALTGVKEQGSEVIIISVDRLTRRLFNKYNFSDLGVLKTKRISNALDEPEFLMFLETNSSNFNKTIKMLQENTQNLELTRIPY